MEKRYVCIWFRYLLTDYLSLREPGLACKAFVITSAVHGRMVITAANEHAIKEGINKGMVLADARAITTDLQVKDEQPQLAERLLKKVAEWAIRFSPVVTIDPPEGIIIDASGCSHLWGGEEAYLQDISLRLQKKGFDVKVAIADTIGTAWALSRFGNSMIAPVGNSLTVLYNLPGVSLRLDWNIVERLQKLGLTKVRHFIHMPHHVLRRRFGESIIVRIKQAAGTEEEMINSIVPVVAYEERLPCLEPIITATGIEIAIKELLQKICERLKKEGKGIRKAELKMLKIDGVNQVIPIGTTTPSNNSAHLFKLFELKIDTISPEPGVELFILSIKKVEELNALQETLWSHRFGLNNQDLSELFDRISGRIGANCIHRYMPAEHYWPERSISRGPLIVDDKIRPQWKADRLRPVVLLPVPKKIEVTAPIPDYPPMLFRYNGKLHKIKKADGPERIEQEWWIKDGEHRDYYIVEDDDGKRYWLFRSGHYNIDQSAQWYLHGYFP